MDRVIFKGKEYSIRYIMSLFGKYLSLILGINYFKVKKWKFVAQLRIKKVNLFGFLLLG